MREELVRSRCKISDCNSDRCFVYTLGHEVVDSIKRDRSEVENFSWLWASERNSKTVLVSWLDKYQANKGTRCIQKEMFDKNELNDLNHVSSRYRPGSFAVSINMRSISQFRTMSIAI